MYLNSIRVDGRLSFVASLRELVLLAGMPTVGPIDLRACLLSIFCIQLMSNGFSKTRHEANS